jgi:Tol biopolymer transport system component
MMFASHRVDALLAVVLLGSAACATGTVSSGPSASPAPASTSTLPPSPVAAVPAATAIPTPRPTPVAVVASASPTTISTSQSTPIAVLPGEPWIAYHWPRVGGDGRYAIFLMRPDGSGVHEIAADVPGEHKGPAWSPDGSKLAFVVQDTDHPEGSIWTAKADGSGAALLSAGGTECPVGLFWPAWSADGTKLAVVCYPGGSDRESLAVMDLATKSLKRLADFASPVSLNSPPTWSPDGMSIAFTIQQWDPTGTSLDWTVVATVPAAGGAVHRLTAPAAFMSHPDWSPDGTELVMNSYDVGNIKSTPEPSNLYSIKPDGSGLRQLTHSSVDGSMRIGTPNWDPDGSRIAVSILTATGPTFDFADVHLAFVPAAGGEPVLIPTALDGKYPDVRPTP